ncbi:hypothetical protein BOTBODRAFT_28426 [Botryobasidium botryosum FD-172 SS1]|uniref:Protein kinase domain-containing protein n=1 Tax=Botryobasidium botryosum (strain FD-172 SS1) TaxID=930990 RepID=A0A067N497_BOTB1|nr:hypothetical protein BOTBODRAFT_28426 [Botryobasidium botryosum FD-172 SS1]
MVCGAAKLLLIVPITVLIVFEEIGRSATSLIDLLKTLLGVAKALDLLSKRGFVHRDVGTHNMALVGDTVKLCDLEFA